MSIGSTLGKLMVIGIALAILGITSANPGSVEVQGQKRTTEVEQGLVKVLPAKPIVQRPTMASTPPPAPLSRAEQQRLLQSTLTSLRHQDNANPTLNLGKVFPLVATPSIPSAPGIILSTPYPISNAYIFHTLYFFKAFSVATDSRSGPPGATWLGDNADGDSDLYGFLRVHITADSGATYLLDFTVNQFRPGGGSVAPMEVNIVLDFTERRGGGSVAPMEVKPGPLSLLGYAAQVRLDSGRPRVLAAHMEMGVTRGHILVPYFESRSGFEPLKNPGIDIEVFSRTGWTFHSVEITRLN